jgi:phenylacetate-CoA ligase
VLQMKDLYKALQELGIPASRLLKPLTDLPLLLHYGRADMTVSFFGANISPVDVEEVIFNLPYISAICNSFCIGVKEDMEGNKQLIVSLELGKGEDPDNFEQDKMQADFFNGLARTNQDFREARKMASGSQHTCLNLYEYGQGPFVNSDIRIKAKYIN